MSRTADETTKLTIRLPREQVEFLKAFALAHGLTATEVISRYLRRLEIRQAEVMSGLSPEVREFVGSLPADFDREAARDAYLQEKYGK